jgi:23S rRNA (adenine2503-C2)-methyltransferase
MTTRIDIRTQNIDDIINFCISHNLPKFRGSQIWEWLWLKNVSSFDEMTSISKSIRILLNDNYIITKLKIDGFQKSKDETIKYKIRLHDNLFIETVLIKSRNRLTVCVSSQVGCSLACSFCATGMLKLKRNLTTAEIYDQVYLMKKEAMKNFNRPISNIVFMGMGEPLLNFKSLTESIDLITNEKGLGMSPKRITVSTAGISKMIKKLGDRKVRFNLAISLHSANDIKREKLMDINKKINLLELKEAIKYFYQKTKTRVTYEYILLKNINDTINDAKDLVKLVRDVPSKVNLIEYNKVEGILYEKSNQKNTENFIKYLEEKHVVVNLRRSKGKDIDAACGQLINKSELI